ncbi:S-adenosylhomocysteine hydrolase [Microbacterium testaceum StLB037]|uniref:S-adenosylhomocysteine hydrolase n=1 Tax=Microbacterium testaceum (strain StLB037) TaxID=979556 RepID=E8NG31_MICTS|nr:S-adenosylhomocysteine hydrolase [Microbacterium testaceum]BAJ75294.1 S-adenosylhomocysteine hydrolase [Microbacterium testaceum StLB037]
MSSFRSFTPDRIDALLPVSLRLHREWRSALDTLSYGGALPPLPLALRTSLRDVAGLDLAHTLDGVDPFASPAFGILYSRLRAEQVLRAVSARTNLTLAGTTVTVVGDGLLSEALATSLRTLGAAVIRATDAPVAALAARLDGFRVQPLEQLSARDAPVHLTVLSGEGRGILPLEALEGLVADASPRGAVTEGIRTSASSRPFVGRAGATSLVEMPSPLPEAEVAPSSTQWRLLDALIALLLLDRHDAGDDDRFAREVTP